MDKILIVEDEEAIADFLKVSLRREGFEVVWARDGEEAVRLFTSEQPQAVLLDLLLPRLSGLEVLKAIRRQANTPVLVVSVKDDESDKVCALELGADDYLTKPFSTRELVARIRTNLRKSQAGPIAVGPLQIDFQRAEVNTVIENGELEAARKQVRLALLGVEEAPVRADPAKTRQVVENLLDNAVRCSPAGADVEVRVDCEGQDVTVSVLDRGPGIPPEDRERVFLRHIRASPEESPLGNMGLGLSIAWEVIRMHGRELTVEARAGGGSLFRFSLSVAVAGAAPGEQPGPK